jgi:hypothetical protein
MRKKRWCWWCYICSICFCVSKVLKRFWKKNIFLFFCFKLIFLMFLDYFDVLTSKIIFKKYIKNIILIHFRVKSTLKTQPQPYSQTCLVVRCCLSWGAVITLVVIWRCCHCSLTSSAFRLKVRCGREVAMTGLLET